MYASNTYIEVGISSIEILEETDKSYGSEAALYKFTTNTN